MHMILLSYVLGWLCLGPPTARNCLAFLFRKELLMNKILSIFIDESGDVCFINDASKYYIVSFVFHNQQNDIKSNLSKIKNYPVFHAGPIIRREYPFENMDMIERKKYFNIYLFLHYLYQLKLKLLFMIKKYLIKIY